MSTAQRTLPAEVRALLDAHLDAVERVLTASNMPRAERRAICDEVENQAREMLWQRASAAPSASAMRSVLAELDPPEAYREAGDSEQLSREAVSPEAVARTNRLALAAIILPTSAIGLTLLGIAPRNEGAMYVYIAFISVISGILGIAAIRQIRRNPALELGTGLAVSGMLIMPLVVLNFAAYLYADYYKTTHFDSVVFQAARFERMTKDVADLRKELAKIRNEHPQKQELVQLLKQDEAELRPLTDGEKRIIALEPTLTILTFVIVMGASAALSIALLVGLTRGLRPAYSP